MIVRKWLLEPDAATGYLSVKEAVLFLQRLAQLERSGATQGSIQVRHLCMHPQHSAHLFPYPFLNLCHKTRPNKQCSIFPT
jgi:hypothetical protein